MKSRLLLIDSAKILYREGIISSFNLYGSDVNQKSGNGRLVQDFYDLVRVECL